MHDQGPAMTVSRRVSSAAALDSVTCQDATVCGGTAAVQSMRRCSGLSRLAHYPLLLWVYC